MFANLRPANGSPLGFNLHLNGAGSTEKPYTPGDHIEGFVSINTAGEVPPGRLVVILQGIWASRCIARRVTKALSGKSSIGVDQAMVSRSKSEQIFLKSNRTFDPMDYTDFEVIEGLRTYRFAFSFELPTTLPLRVCKHRTQSLAVYESHLRIPPTMGNAYGDPSGPTYPTDKLACSVQIAYTIHAMLYSPSTRGSHASVASEIKPIQIIPSFDPEPPREAFGSQLYCTFRERNFKDRLWTRHTGRLTVSASQPEPLKLGYINPTELQNPCTTAVIDLNFDQEGSSNPPQLCSLTTRLTAVTFYGEVPWESYPDLLVGKCSFADYGRGMDWKVMPISKMCVESVRWIEKPAYSPCDQFPPPHLALGSESPSTIQHAVSIVVPITAPKDVYLVPTFHSCLISRVYLLEFSISYKQSDSRILTSHLSLRVPIQIIVQSKANTGSSENVTSRPL